MRIKRVPCCVVLQVLGCYKIGDPSETHVKLKYHNISFSAVNTLRPEQGGRRFGRRHFKMQFCQ